MRFSVRPYLMAGVGIVAAGSIAIPPSVAPPSHAPRQESVALAAHTQPVNPLLTKPQPELATAQAATALLPAAAFESTEAMTETLDVASAQVSALALPGLESAIINAYDIIMPWVDWGVNLGIYATQWIPVVNWFTPQISIFYYSLIRPIITSAVFNIAYWVGGTVSFGQGLTNFFNDTVDAGIGFVNAEIDWLLSFLPPFPPFPPFFSALAAQSTMEVMGARTAIQVPAGVGTALAEAPDEESPTTPGEDAQESAPPAESGTPPTAPADEPVRTPIDTEPEDVEPQAPVETPATDVDQADEEDLTDADVDQDADVEQDADVDQDADVEQGVDVEDKTDVDADLGTDKPDTVKDDSGPKADSDTDDKNDTKPDTKKPDTKNDAKPSPKNDSGSGSDE